EGMTQRVGSRFSTHLIQLLGALANAMGISRNALRVVGWRRDTKPNIANIFISLSFARAALNLRKFSGYFLSHRPLNKSIIVPNDSVLLDAEAGIKCPELRSLRGMSPLELCPAPSSLIGAGGGNLGDWQSLRPKTVYRLDSRWLNLRMAALDFLRQQHGC
ncbi:MAG: hypothetical protein AAF892_13735, partial [Cyanobacteria bacterium P01_D01_bin.71]